MFQRMSGNILNTNLPLPHLIKKKVKFTLEQATKGQRYLYSFFNLDNRCSGPFAPGKESHYPLYRRLGGPRGQSGWVRKLSSPTGFDFRISQPVASRYTNYAIPTHTISYTESLFYLTNIGCHFF